MNLWIRTQDKKALTKVENIQVLEVHDGRWILISFNKESEDVTLGVYESVEKALEILDKIQSLIRGGIIIRPKHLVELEDAKHYYELLNNREVSIFGREMDVLNTGTDVVFEMPLE